MEKRNKTLEWIRAVRDKMYEDWRNDPIGFEQKRKKDAERYAKKYSEQRKDKVV